MVSELVFKELVKRGYSKEGGRRVWDISNQSLLFSTLDLSRAFLNLKTFPVYRKNVIDREMDLIKESAHTLRASLGSEPFNLIDMGCANGERAIAFLKALGSNVKVRYCPMSVSDLLTKEAVIEMKRAGLKNVVSYSSQKADFKDLGTQAGALRNAQFQRNVILLLGSSLATFEINDFLFNLSKELFRGDYLIIGNGIRTGRRLVHLEVYKHKVFNEWFMHLMKELGFNSSDLQYDARFGNSRVECFYKVKNPISVAHQGKKIAFKQGDEVLAAVIYKYYAKELEKFCRMYFPEGEFLKDEDNEYALVLCKK